MATTPTDLTATQKMRIARARLMTEAQISEAQAIINAADLDITKELMSALIVSLSLNYHALETGPQS
jgi:hypothetical protein